jgi:uncharacterized protein (TIGR03067 family)
MVRWADPILHVRPREPPADRVREPRRERRVFELLAEGVAGGPWDGGSLEDPYILHDRGTQMRIAILTLLCALVLPRSDGTGARADDKPNVEKELKKVQGTWTFESVVMAGKEEPAANFKNSTLTFDGAEHTVKNGNDVIQVGTQTIDPSKSPKTIDVTITEGPSKGMVMLGIYEISGDTLKVCFDMEGKKRPTEFKSAPGSLTFLNVHKRVKK